MLGRLKSNPKKIIKNIIKFKLGTTYHLPGRMGKYNVFVIGKQANICAKYLKKDSLVLIEGYIKNQQDNLVIIAQTIKFALFN